MGCSAVFRRGGQNSRRYEALLPLPCDPCEFPPNHQETMMRVTGACHCGHITYEAEVDPATIRICHCTDCQKLTGTAFRATIASLPESFRLNSGTPKTYLKTAESGNQR